MVMMVPGGILQAGWREVGESISCGEPLSFGFIDCDIDTIDSARTPSVVNAAHTAAYSSACNTSTSASFHRPRRSIDEQCPDSLGKQDVLGSPPSISTVLYRCGVFKTAYASEVR